MAAARRGHYGGGMIQPDLSTVAAQLLRWHVDMGVDVALDDVPHDRLAEAAAAAQAPAREMPRPVARDAPAEAAQAARSLARGAGPSTNCAPCWNASTAAR